MRALASSRAHERHSLYTRTGEAEAQTPVLRAVVGRVARARGGLRQGSVRRCALTASPLLTDSASRVFARTSRAPARTRAPRGAPLAGGRDSNVEGGLSAPAASAPRAVQAPPARRVVRSMWTFPKRGSRGWRDVAGRRVPPPEPIDDTPPYFDAGALTAAADATYFALSWPQAHDDVNALDSHIQYLIFASESPGTENLTALLAVATGETELPRDGSRAPHPDTTSRRGPVERQPNAGTTTSRSLLGISQAIDRRRFQRSTSKRSSASSGTCSPSSRGVAPSPTATSRASPTRTWSSRRATATLSSRTWSPGKERPQPARA